VIAERISAGTLRDIVGVPTSIATERRATELGIPLATLNDVPHLDVTIDGADEVGPGLDLIKGHGGALLWEKLVACSTDRLVIVADESKLVKGIGTRVALPVEVIPFGWATHAPFFAELGCEGRLRRAHGEPVVTDAGHYLIDCAFPGGIHDPVGVATALKARVGIVETGLFIGMTDVAVIAGADGVRVIEREASK
jgi:ribose 5-phosphate isomerase A